MAQTVKHLPAMQEDWGSIPGLGRSPEKGMATHSSTLAWRIPWTEEPGGLQSTRLQRVGHDWVTNTFTFFRVKYAKLTLKEEENNVGGKRPHSWPLGEKHLCHSRKRHRKSVQMTPDPMNTVDPRECAILLINQSTPRKSALLWSKPILIDTGGSRMKPEAISKVL